MSRMMFAAVAWIMVAGGATPAQDGADPVKDRLDKARAAHGADLEKARDGLLALMKQKEEAAQKTGDLAQFKKARAERQAVAEGGEVPNVAVASEYHGAVRKARERLEAAYVQARKEYTQAGKLTEAEAVDIELGDSKEARRNRRSCRVSRRRRKTASPSASSGPGALPIRREAVWTRRRTS